MEDETWDAFIEESGDIFNPLPEGTYDFVITEAEGKISGKGNHMVRVSAKVVSGPEAGKAIKDFYVIRAKVQKIDRCASANCYSSIQPRRVLV